MASESNARYGRELWEYINSDIKLYGLQSSAVISTPQWSYYVLFHKTVSVLNTFSIFSGSCNTKQNHLPPSESSLTQFAEAPFSV